MRASWPRSPSFGLFQLWAEPGVAELYAMAGLDFVVIDMEAGALDRAAVMRIVQALHGHDISVLVRLAAHDRPAIEHALDIGADGVLVPKVESADEARAVAEAAKFPPLGRRGVNPVRASGYFADVPGYLAGANDSTLCLVQIESAAAAAVASDIAAVPGIDGLFIGMGDLAMDLGQPGVMTGDRVDTIRAAVLKAASENGIVAGIFAYTEDLARSYRDEGFEVIAVGNEIKLLREAITRTAGNVR
ncbi:4-hydroxy-2-oxovalerate aldolase [Actinoplanes regularis]|nr:4-hydroxy-2-oxovalerate aldolase [Actinoplanes regularis]